MQLSKRNYHAINIDFNHCSKFSLIVQKRAITKKKKKTKKHLLIELGGNYSHILFGIYYNFDIYNIYYNLTYSVYNLSKKNFLRNKTSA